MIESTTDNGARAKAAGRESSAIPQLASWGLHPVSMHAREYRNGAMLARNQVFIRTAQ
jgi:hypothetical protein